MKKVSFKWINNNIKNTTSGTYLTFPKKSKSLKIKISEGDITIKLRIIDLVTKEIPSLTNTHIEELVFEDYDKVINKENKKFKEQGAMLL